MTSTSLLNASRISHVAQSTTIEDATQMGLLDRIIDFFRGGTKRDAIETLFNSIAALRYSAGFNYQDGTKIEDDNLSGMNLSEISETERLDKFLALRELALPEYRDQFKYDIHENKNGTYGCSITIGGVEVYKNSDISSFHDKEKIPNLYIEKFRLDVEDSARREDPVPFLKSLNEVGSYIDKMLLAEPDEISANGPEPRQRFSYDKMEEIFQALPDETKEMLFSKGTSAFGNRIRGILNFGYEALSRAGQTTLEKISIPQGPTIGLPPHTWLLDSFAPTATQLTIRPLELQSRLVELITVCARRPNSEHMHTAVSGTEPVFITIDDGSLPPIPPLSSTEYKSLDQLSDADIRALNMIGIPDSILRQ